MNEKEKYWFPVRPAEDGWGWGLPIAWQGWLAFILFFVALIAGMSLIAFRYGPVVMVAYAIGLAALFFLVLYLKGEPQSRRHNKQL